jgi:hypothetical protein
VPIDTQILSRSCASERFKTEVVAFVSREEAPSITLTRNVPRIKVIRLINHLLYAHPEWAIERLHIGRALRLLRFRRDGPGGSRR